MDEQTSTDTEATPKRFPALTEEKKAKMAEGRKLYYENRRREKEEAKLAAKAARQAARNAPPPPLQVQAQPLPRPLMPTLPSAPSAQDVDPLGFMDKPNPVVPDFSGSRPKALLDLFNLFPVGDGQHFVQVNRTAPKRMYEQQIGGIQKQIRTPLTDEEFFDTYGGGEYELRVYRMDTGQDGMTRSRPLTEPIKWVVPGLPNIDAALQENSDVQYTNQRQRVVRGVSPMQQHPDVAKAEIDFRRDRSHRDDEKEDRERERAEAAVRLREDHEMRKAEFMVGTNEAEIKRLEAQNREKVELAQQAAEARSLAAVAKAEAEAAAAKAAANKPQVDPVDFLLKAKDLFGTNNDTALASLQAQLNQTLENHKNELTRVHKDQESQLKAERERADLRIKDADERAERRVKDAEGKTERALKDAEERFNKRMTEVETAAMRRVSEVETRAQDKIHDTERRCDERIRDLGINWETRMKDQERNHDREIRAKESELGMSKTSVEMMLKSEVNQVQSELKRVERELGRVQHERDDYKLRAENWLDQMEKFKTQAEAMGYVSADEAGGEEGPKDWKAMLMQIASNTAGNIPEILKSAGEAVRNIRAPGSAPEMVRAQARQQMAARAGHTVPRQMAAAPAYMPPFATEDGPSFPPVGPPLSAPPRAIMPTTMPNAVPVVAPAPVQMELPIQQSPMPVQAAPEPQPVQQHAANPASPAPAPSVVPPPSGAGGAEDGASILIHDIVQSLEHGVPPEHLAQAIFAQADDNSKEFFRTLTFDQITLMLSQQPTEEAKKLTRREGQTYLKKIWSALHALLGPAPAPVAEAS